MILPLTALLGLAQACAPAVAPQTLLSVVQAESGRDPFVVSVNAPRRQTYRPTTAAAATALAARLIGAGANLDLGLGQINSRNLAWLGLTPAQAFDPCRNLAASARVLEAGYRRAAPGEGGPQTALRAALSAYNTGDPRRGLRNGYVARVVAAAARVAPALGPEPPDPAATPAAPATALDPFAPGAAARLDVF